MEFVPHGQIAKVLMALMWSTKIVLYAVVLLLGHQSPYLQNSYRNN